MVFGGVRRVAVEQRLPPQIQDPRDVIVRVQYSAICGSDLHVYRGHEACLVGTILGHEFIGTVVEKGENVQTLSVGDSVVSPFTVSCGACFFCRAGLSSRCEASALYGSTALPGAQAEFVRVPYADTTAVKALETLRPVQALLMADVFPTGYYAVASAFELLPPQIAPADATVLIVGCGPVGVCAVVAASARGPRQLLAVDAVPERLKLAGDRGAQPVDLTLGAEDVVRRVREATGGRGADVVVELVGQKPALMMAFEALRPGGVLVSLGVHHDECPWSLAEGKRSFHAHYRYVHTGLPVHGQSFSNDVLVISVR